ncbi:kinase [Candidatus Kaiserbacteria bacterium]|nr:kinase [Candidatus Kaiserbacteria bacterium]
MVITRTPFRISFFGGGTDYPAWYQNHGGAVLSGSIDKYCYLILRHFPPFFEYRYRVRYAINENTTVHDDIEHPAVRESLKFLHFKDGVEIMHTADLPAMSGLGSSSSFTVGLLHGLQALRDEHTTKKKLADDAIYVEQKRIKENVGSQDQVAAAFGGLNKITFGGKGGIKVSPIDISKKRVHDLEDHLLLFFTGFSRRASDIAGKQIKAIPKKAAELRRMQAMVDEGKRILEPRGRLTDFGELLHEGWMLKRGLSSVVTNDHLDSIYERGRAAGAIGGKILGAGGGGFMLFFVPREKRSAVRTALKELLCVPFRFETKGSQIIFTRPSEKYEVFEA